jgi:hypothetical protein
LCWTVATATILQYSMATAALAAASGGVDVAWSQPVAGATVSTTLPLQLAGHGLQRVEIYRGDIRIAQAKVSADGTGATATINTGQFANGSVALMARAWGSDGSEADAAALSVTVNNATRLGNVRDLLGVFVGNQASAVIEFEGWLGRQVDGILGFTGDASWEDYEGSAGWAANSVWNQIDRPVFWSVPLIPQGATLAAAASGAYNEHYRRVAETLIGSRPKDANLFIRTGWEFNGNWMRWSAIGKEREFIGAYRQFVTTFRAVAKEHGEPDRFIFEWNVSCAAYGMNPEDAYPGDEYVDIIGMDVYWNPAYDPKDPLQAWQWKLNAPYGLMWHQEFAAAHGKRTAYSEWGVRGDNAGPFIQQAKAWFTQHDVVFQTYWDSNAGFPGKLSNEQYPSAATAFYGAFRAPQR